MLSTADKDAQKGKKPRAGGSGVDLAKVAQEQQAKLDKVRGEITELRAAKAKEAQEAAAEAALSSGAVCSGGDDKGKYKGHDNRQLKTMIIDH